MVRKQPNMQRKKLTRSQRVIRELKSLSMQDQLDVLEALDDPYGVAAFAIEMSVKKAMQERHDMETLYRDFLGAFIQIGVAVFCNQGQFTDGIIRSGRQKLSAAYENLDAKIKELSTKTTVLVFDEDNVIKLGEIFREARDLIIEYFAKLENSNGQKRDIDPLKAFFGEQNRAFQDLSTIHWLIKSEQENTLTFKQHIGRLSCEDYDDLSAWRTVERIAKDIANTPKSMLDKNIHPKILEEFKGRGWIDDNFDFVNHGDNRRSASKYMDEARRSYAKTQMSEIKKFQTQFT